MFGDGLIVRLSCQVVGLNPGVRSLILKHETIKFVSCHKHENIDCNSFTRYAVIIDTVPISIKYVVLRKIW